MRSKCLAFKKRASEREENVALPLKMTETIGSGFPNFVLGMLVADSTITRSMALRESKLLPSGGEDAGAGAGPSALGEDVSRLGEGFSRTGRVEEAGWGGGALEDYLQKAQRKLISTLPESTQGLRHGSWIQKMWTWKRTPRRKVLLCSKWNSDGFGTNSRQFRKTAGMLFAS